MAIPKRSLQGEWGGPFAFVFALTGAAIGLGNLWAFPALVTEHGGGAFLLAYAGFLVLMVLPLWLAEIGLGRSVRRTLPDGIHRMATAQGRSGLWAGVGWLAVTMAGLLLVLQVMVGGALGAWLQAVAVDRTPVVDAVTTTRVFASLWAEPERWLLWHTLTVGGACLVVGQGLVAGTQRLMRALVPAAFLLLAALVAWAAQWSSLVPAWERVFDVRFDRLGWDGVQAAGEYALFSTVVALGIATVYGAALSDRWPVLSSAGAALALDFLFAALAALLVSALLLPGGGGDGMSGPVLMLHVLPEAMLGLPGGREATLGLALLLLIVVFTTVIALMQVAVGAVVEQGRVERIRATALVGGAAWLTGVLALVATTWWLNAGTGEAGLFTAVAGFAWVAIPAVALLILAFTGWCVPAEVLRGALRLREDWRYDFWMPMLRYVAPLILLALLARVSGALPL